MSHKLSGYLLHNDITGLLTHLIEWNLVKLSLCKTYLLWKTSAWTSVYIIGQHMPLRLFSFPLPCQSPDSTLENYRGKDQSLADTFKANVKQKAAEKHHDRDATSSYTNLNLSAQTISSESISFLSIEEKSSHLSHFYRKVIMDLKSYQWFHIKPNAHHEPHEVYINQKIQRLKRTGDTKPTDQSSDLGLENASI